MKQEFKNTRNNLLFICLCVIGGTTYAFQKLGLTEGLPLWSAGMRILLAGIIMLIYSFYKGNYIYSKENLITGIKYGFFYFAFPFGIIYWVGQFLPSGLLSVLSASVSVFAVILNLFFHNEKTYKFQIYGILLSVLGIAIIFFHSIFLSYETNMTFCLIICIIAYMGAAYATAYLKSKIHTVDQISFNIIALLTGGGSLCIVSLLVEQGKRSFSGSSLISLVYLALAGSMFSTRITTFLISQWNVAKVTTYRYISPVISLLVGFIFWGEVLSYNEIIGGILIVLGTIVINRPNPVNSNNMAGNKGL